MSSCDTPTTPSRSPMPARQLAVAQQLPQTVLALVALHLTLDTSAQRHDTFEDRQKDARSFARVCRAWRAAGTAAVWREVEVLDRASRSDSVGKHLETYPQLFKHVESISVAMSYLGSVLSPSIVASCPRLSRLELRIDHYVGPTFQALQDTVDLTKLVEVVMYTADWSWHSWHRCATADRLVSTNLLFAFVRACPNVRRFTYDGLQETVNETNDAPRGRRIKLDSLTLDIKDTTLNSETARRSSSIRSRFMVQFDLSRLVIFEAHVNLRDGDILIALDRMVNLETLRLVDDHGLDVAALDTLGPCLGRRIKLRNFDVPAVPEVDCPTSPAVLEAVKRLVDALPTSVERLTLSVPLPEPFAETLLEGRDGLEHFHAHIYDPLEVRPEAREVHWRKTVEPVYESADERDELDEEKGAEGP